MTAKKSERNRTLTVSEEEIPELEKKVGIGWTGDDCLINADFFDVIPQIPDNYFDLVIVDPPYNLNKKFSNFEFYQMTGTMYEEYLKSWFYLVCDKLKDNGTLYMCGDWKCSSSMQSVIQQRLTVLNRITWQREKGRGAKGNWKNGMEDIWMAVKNPKDYYFNVDAVMMKRKVIAPYKVNGIERDWKEEEDGKFRMTYPSNFWDDISIPFWSMPENTDHPTQKPEKLYAKLILASSKEGDIILDPFMGSGTAPVVAKKLGRHYCGIEMNREYCLWAAKRIAKADEDKTIQGYKDGVFWERNSGK